ncbi:MAG: undecaprenyl-phosphate glucose phosphotransferase [Armatimonadota bacterium]|nr:undecaprenyl-phosphate glucose phosphotransferase [Armatimonadota bacterium]MCX7776518.1 undecaprenyl-phosphate glucose phosphotransferase [Armatimonadota bacterium]MDW8024315.1 undecaprenyl-phosphate glucose phosphotransferase [Armatimonadota bacterium]
MQSTEGYKRRLRWHHISPYILLVQDALMALIGFAAAYQLRFFGLIAKWLPPYQGIPPINIHTGFIALHVLSWLLCLHFVGLYRRYRERHAVDEFYSVLVAGFIAGAIVGTLAMLLRYQWLSRIVFVMAEVLTILMLGIGRMVFKAVEQMLWRSGIGVSNVAIVGAKAKCLVEQFTVTGYGCRVIGVVELSELGSEDHEMLWQRLECRLSAMGGLDEIIVAENSLPDSTLMRLLDWAEGHKINVRLMLSLVDVIKRRGQFEEIAGMPSVTVTRLPLRTWGALAKRLMDISLSLLLLVIFALPMLFIALLIKLTSKGPVLYRQERVGQDGKVFVMLKFRTMREGAEDDTGPIWAMPDDPRCTKIGKMLRRLSLDELPQLFNVLKGEMSLVGPRPERPYFVEQFAQRIPRYMERHRIKAGITGWAQVNGLRGNCPIEERTKYDLYYVENWSLLLDLKILIKTFFEVLFHKGAY